MLRKALRYCVAGVAVIIMALVALRMTSWWDGLLPPGDHRAVRFETLVLTSKPNQYLVCPPDLCTEAKAHQESPQFDRTADDLRAAFETVVLGSEAVTKMAESDGRPLSDGPIGSRSGSSPLARTEAPSPSIAAPSTAVRISEPTKDGSPTGWHDSRRTVNGPNVRFPPNNGRDGNLGQGPGLAEAVL